MKGEVHGALLIAHAEFQADIQKLVPPFEQFDYFFDLKIHNGVAAAIDPGVYGLEVHALVSQVQDAIDLDERYNLLDSEFSPSQLRFLAQ